jgi:RNA recognition motif-containing protein
MMEEDSAKGRHFFWLPYSYSRSILKLTHPCTRFGYVEFDNVDQCAQAIEGLDQQVFEGRRLTVQYSIKKGARPQRTSGDTGASNAPTKTLFIGNMSFEMSDKDLNELFREIHNVIDVRVAIDRKTGQPRGFAHAEFIDVTSAQKAYDLLNNKEVYGRKLRIDYSSPSLTPRRMPDQLLLQVGRNGSLNGYYRKIGPRMLWFLRCSLVDIV